MRAAGEFAEQPRGRVRLSVSRSAESFLRGAGLEAVLAGEVLAPFSTPFPGFYLYYPHRPHLAGAG